MTSWLQQEERWINWKRHGAVRLQQSIILERLDEVIRTTSSYQSEADVLAHALANQEVGAKLINLSTVESDYNLAAAERKAGRALEVVAGVAGAQVC